ncbi:reticulon-1 isoform X2 [Frankliniella occidentalis]|uniref:Reticulon-like protein n=1 Tax=Frankliniella occidentalis TaxID=133901 RepID=A0A6J1SGK9_FRAOC|nr:reticulon-1 isoform X2 [Frankliniella occidentalis]
MDSEELKAFERKSEVPPPHDPLDDFLSGGIGQGANPQHFAEPIRNSPPAAQAGKDIMDTMSFLHHESQPHFTPAAGDTFMDNQYSGSPDKEDYSLEDEVIRHKTPSPDLLPEPTKKQPSTFDENPLDDFGTSFGFSPKKSDPSPHADPLEDFLSKPAPAREPSPEPIREPSPKPVREPTPEPVREPSPPPVREPSPLPVREPTPEPIRVPTPEPPPKPKAAPIPTFLESEYVEKKPEKKEPEPKPVISKPTSPPPAPPKQVSSGGTKSCDGLVEALVYWRDPKKSGIVFGGIMVVLLSLSFFSFISVVANLSLLALTAAFGFRIYKTVQQAIQKTSDGHPFKEILELDLTLPAEKVRSTSDLAVTHINAVVSELRRLFLVEDFIDSVKFGVGLWMLTYVGSWFNGMTLIILGVVALFTLPKVYETNKAQIDQNIELVAGKVNEITAKVRAAIPIGKKAEEKKEQ